MGSYLRFIQDSKQVNKRLARSGEAQKATLILMSSTLSARPVVNLENYFHKENSNFLLCFDYVLLLCSNAPSLED
jgi:hypothetical protein